MLLCIGLCLLFALTPIADFDFDGSPDLFLTDGLLLILALPGSHCPRIFHDRAPRRLPRLAEVVFASLIVPPPVII